VSLLNPSALWLALVGLPVLLLFLLKVRRREVVIPSTLFWRRVLAQKRESAWWRRLRSLLSLLLHLLFIAGGTFALTQPFLQPSDTSDQPRLSVIVVDTSASMRTVEDADKEETRLDEAREKIFAKLDALVPGTKVAVIGAGVRPEIIMPVTDDRASVRTALEKMEATDTGGDLMAAIDLADDLAMANAPAEVEVFSDGGGVEEGAARREDAPKLVYHRIGLEDRNVGITAFALRRLPASDAELEMLVGLKNTTDKEVALELQIYLDGVQIDSVGVEVAARSDEVKVFNRAMPRGGAVGVAISEESAEKAGDALPADNYAYTMLADRDPIKVLLVSSGDDFFLTKAIGENPAFEAYIVTPAEFGSSAGMDVVVFNEVAPAKEPVANALYVSSVGSKIPFVAAPKKLDLPTVRYLDEEHPLLRHVELHDAAFAASRPVTPPEGSTVVVDGTAGPLLVAWERTERRDAYLAVSESDSDLPLRVAYPNLISNLVTWLGEPRGEDTPPVLNTGEIARIPVSDGVKELLVVLPNGEEDHVEVRPGMSVVPYGHTVHAGIYVATEVYSDEALAKLAADKGAGAGATAFSPVPRRFAANLTDLRESDIAPVEELGLDESAPPTVVMASGIWSWLASRPLWRYLVIIALALIALEWLLYARRWVY